MPTPMSLAGIDLPSKEAFIDLFRQILYRDKLGTEIVGEDRRVFEALLRARPDKMSEVGARKVVRFVRMMHRHNTPAFFAELEDGALLDISFMKWVKA